MEKIDLEKYDGPTQRKLEMLGAIINYAPNNLKFLKMHMDKSKTRLILGGKRSGKSTFGVVEVCWAALGIHPFLDYPAPPLKIRVCSVDFENGIKGIIIPMLKKWLGTFDGGPFIKKYWAEPRILEFKNGTEIDFKSYDQDLEKFEGVERHLVWMDEEPPRDKYESNYMRTVSGGINGKLLITCTPLHGLTWLYDTLYDNPLAVPPYVSNIHVSIYENPHLDPEAVEAIKHDPALKDNVEAAMYGHFISKTGLIYKDFGALVKFPHIIAPIQPKPEDMIMLGIDPHDRNPHGVVFCMLNRENEITVYDEILEACVIGDLVKKIKDKLKTRFPSNLAVIDTSAHAPQSISGMSVADELNRLGLPTISAFKDWEPGVMKVAGMLNPGNGKKPKLFITENCQQLIREFRHYVWADWGKSKDRYNPKEMPTKKDDHLLDALRYVCMTNIVYRPPGFTVRRTAPFAGHMGKTGYF